MLKVNYIIHENNEEAIQEITNSQMPAHKFLQIVSHQHDMLFHHLYLDEKEIDSSENLINILKQGYHTFTVSEEPISFNSPKNSLEKFIKYMSDSKSSDEISDEFSDFGDLDSLEDSDIKNNYYSKLTIQKMFNVDDFKVNQVIEDDNINICLVSKKTDKNIKYYVEMIDQYQDDLPKKSIIKQIESLLNISHPY